MIFENLTTARFTAFITGTSNKMSFDGCTTAATTPENAKAQIDKLMGIVNKSVATTQMKRIITQEAKESN